MYQHTPQAILHLTSDGIISYANSSFSRISGYSVSEVVGGTPSIMFGDDSSNYYASIRESVDKNGAWHGEIMSKRKNGEVYTQSLSVVAIEKIDGDEGGYVVMFNDISREKQVESMMSEMVNHDSLTGLPNRHLMNILLSHAIKRGSRENTQVGVLFVDLDRFKSVNETLGYEIGDMLLYGVKKRLLESVRVCDTIARMGSDEFAIILDGLKSREDALGVAEKVIESLSVGFAIKHKDVFVTASVGISMSPDDGDCAEDLVSRAEIAMAQARKEGKSQVMFYNSSIGEQAKEKHTMEHLMRGVVSRNELVVHFQPQVSLKDNRIVGAEALVRWIHPEIGMISPAKFIPMAEETGMIIQIGEWVLRESAKKICELEQHGLSLERISVNVSAEQIHRSRFEDTLQGILVETGCNPDRLELEITESAIMHDAEHVIDVCKDIRGMGVRLALDDFGTGYSSLSYLKKFPLDKLKIDQSFVRDLPDDNDDAAISMAIIDLGRNLGMKVIAEGVETCEQEAFLRQKGCEEGQGYLYSRPIPFDELKSLLKNQQIN